MEQMRALMAQVADGSISYLASGKQLQKFVAQEATIFTLHNMAYHYYTEEDDYAKALIFIERALQLPQHSYKTAALAGCILMQLARFDEALPLVEKAATQTQDKQVYYNLGTLYMRDERYLEAAKAYEYAMPDEESAIINAAEAYRQAGDIAMAEQLLAQQYKIWQQNPQLLDVGGVELAECYIMLDDTNKALALYEASWQDYAVGQWLYNYSRLLYRTNQFVLYREMQAYMKRSLQHNLQEAETSEEVAEARQQLQAFAEFDPKSDYVVEMYTWVASSCYYYLCPMHDE